MKKIVKLTESDLMRIVKRIIKEETESPTLNSEFNVDDVITCEIIKDNNSRKPVGRYDFKVKSIDKETYDIKVCLESIKPLNKGEKINQCFVWDKNNKMFSLKGITYSLRFVKKVS
jgi:hypothetical protein